ncbi:MAG: stalk domain-containing protein [Fimbriimonas sp.]
MARNNLPLGTLGMLTLLAIPALSTASPISLRRDSVVPVIFEDGLTMRNTREGDRFFARVDDTRYLPTGTRMEGRVVSIRQGRDRDQGAMDLEFTELIMPDGHRERINALPVPLTDRYVSRDREGRFTVKNDVKRKEGTVLGGMIGGFILGSIFQKQLEGTALGALAGVLIATNDRGNDGNTVISKNQRMGALINRDVNFEWRSNGRRDDDTNRRDDDRWDNRDDRRQDDRRDDRWGQNDRRDDRRDDRWDDRRDDRRDDRDVQITYGVRSVTFTGRDRPYREQGTIMIPLEAASRQMNMRVSKDDNRTDRIIFIDGSEGYLQVELGSREARLNGRQVTMPQAAAERDRTVYVPLEMLAQISRETVYLNGTRVARRSSY